MDIMENQSNTQGSHHQLVNEIEVKIEPTEHKICNVTETIFTPFMNLSEPIKNEIEVPVFYEDVNLKEKFETQRKSLVNAMKEVPENSNRELNIIEMSKTGQSLTSKDINVKRTMESDVLRNDLFYYCEICKVKYLSEKSLDKHMKLHDGSRKFKCNTCTYRFKTKAELAIHIMKHSGIMFECDTCEFKTKWKHHFSRHMKQKHREMVLNDKNTNRNMTNDDISGSSQQYPTVPNIDNSQSQNKDGGNTLYHQCNICEYKSFVKHALDKHMKLHDLNRRYQCDVCLYRFNTKTQLGQHMSKHSDKKYSCRVCGRQYKHEYDVIKHMYEHEGVQHKCDMCGHVCDSKNQLSMHISHKHKNSYKCNVCLKMFTDNSFYTRHMRMHLKSKP